MGLLLNLPDIARSAIEHRGFNLHRDVNTAQQLAANTPPILPLIWAIWEGNIVVVKALLDLGADPRMVGKGDVFEKEYSALTACIDYSREGILQMLFTHSQTKDLMDPNICDGDYDVCTPLTFAISTIYEDSEKIQEMYQIVLLLLDHPKIDILKADANNMTPVSVCCQSITGLNNKFPDIHDQKAPSVILDLLRILLKRGANLNAQDWTSGRECPAILELFYPHFDDKCVSEIAKIVDKNILRAIFICLHSSLFEIDLTVYKNNSMLFKPYSFGIDDERLFDSRYHKTPLMLAKKNKPLMEDMLHFEEWIILKGYLKLFELKMQKPHTGQQEIQDSLEKFLMAHIFLPKDEIGNPESEHSKQYNLIHDRLKLFLNLILKTVDRKTLGEMAFNVQTRQQYTAAGFDVNQPCDQILSEILDPNDPNRNRPRTMLTWCVRNKRLHSLACMINQSQKIDHIFDALTEALRVQSIIGFRILMIGLLGNLRNQADAQNIFEKMYILLLAGGIEFSNFPIAMMLLNLEKILPDYFKSENGGFRMINCLNIFRISYDDILTKRKYSILTQSFMRSPDIEKLFLKRLRLAIIDDLYRGRAAVFKVESSNDLQQPRNRANRVVAAAGQVARGIRVTAESCLPAEPFDSDRKKLREAVIKPLTFMHENFLLQMRCLRQPFVRKVYVKQPIPDQPGRFALIKTDNEQRCYFPNGIVPHIMSFVASAEAYDQETRAGLQTLKLLAWESHQLITGVNVHQKNVEAAEAAAKAAAEAAGAKAAAEQDREPEQAAKRARKLYLNTKSLTLRFG